MMQMKIMNLNRSAFSVYGELLGSRPCRENTIEEKHILASSDEMKIYRCTESITVDYSEGMTVLAIYAQDEPAYFYLDRIVRINADVPFSFFPLEKSSGVIVLHNASSELEIAGTYRSLEEEHSHFRLEKILTVFYQETSGNFYFRGESHSAYELTYVDQGTLHNIINGHDYVVSQQECIIIGRNQWHIQYSDLPVKFLTVSFNHSGDLSAITDKVMTISPPLRPVILKILDERNGPRLSAEYMEALLQMLLIELIREPDVPALSAKSPATTFAENVLVDKALKMIAEGISAKIHLSDLAKKLNVSVPYLYKLFDEHLKMPPGQYIMKIRLEESKVLLREGRKTVGEIAKECGFSSIQHYSRQFRKHFEITPSEYIKSLR